MLMSPLQPGALFPVQIPFENPLFMQTAVAQASAWSWALVLHPPKLLTGLQASSGHCWVPSLHLVMLQSLSPMTMHPAGQHWSLLTHWTTSEVAPVQVPLEQVVPRVQPL